jgi:hypothetical protein
VDEFEFSLGKYPQSSLLVVYSDRHEIQLDPDYQRISGIWTREKRQLLLDSLLNGFDVPKLYFHEFVPPKQKGSKRYRYAIIDGKQRLQTIWDFIDGSISLADDFEYLRDGTVLAAGLSYSELAKRYPQVKTRFDATLLDIVTIRTHDIDLIEDMFSRLNEAVPLNAPEKRNAFGGPLPAAIRAVAKHAFFKEHVPFSDKRYRHRDLAAKFLYLEFVNGIANTKKPDLDAFVRDFRKWREAHLPKGSPSAVAKLKTETEKTLAQMAAIFATSDSLLRQVGMITLYYHLFRLIRLGKVDSVTREMLKVFEKQRDENRRRIEETSETDKKVDAQLLEFDKHSQTPNDAYAIRIRLNILLRFLEERFKVAHTKGVAQPTE